jgi:hypothetical protein
LLGLALPILLSVYGMQIICLIVVLRLRVIDQTELVLEMA